MAYEEWREVMSGYGLHTSKFVGDKRSSVSIDRLSLYGCPAAVIGCDSPLMIERPSQEARLDENDSYCVVLQLRGQSMLVQNNRAARVYAGDVALVDMRRPATRYLEDHHNRWLGMQLPRGKLTFNLGVEPEGGLCHRGNTPAARLLFNLVRDAINESDSCAQTQAYMQLVLYDLLGALFGGYGLPEVSPRNDTLFKRICSIITDRFADRNFGPSEVAAQAGISLRYLQKLFTARGLSCVRFIHSVRLDHAAKHLHRRAMLKTGQPLKEIAYSCGFGDYGHFTRTFRRRFGYSPGGVVTEGRSALAALRGPGTKEADGMENIPLPNTAQQRRS